MITGASSGFGRLTAKKFQSEGWNVIATMRKPELETELDKLENTVVFQLDVTKQDSITTSVAKGISRFGSIDVLVNNAGYGGHALFEQFADDDIQAMYATNVFGLMNTTREVLPHMRKNRAGTIINVTSLAGLIGGPTTSVYSSTKFAIEGFTEALAHELSGLNIRVMSVAPGAFATNFGAATQNPSQNGDDDLQKYAQIVFEKMASVRKALLVPEQHPQDVAEKIFECATENVPTRNVVGKDAESLQTQKDTLSHTAFSQQISELFSMS
ncbi:Serine 3-dehydrogenase [Pseudovibrio sp. Ad46]|nr:Serine 3-dehydrogenase [Pseudovibrio sp. Ad46]KZK99423.1 Serine 3-dehydrogenase [Pseudovibrio sp. Ad5]KZL02610.1 Serine 3-dehydrogenase [Pseudovibrio sp. W74]KZL07847.1 Serine 3-dehydrogenase [Pseudovibrio sp. Ad14]